MHSAEEIRTHFINVLLQELRSTETKCPLTSEREITTGFYVLLEHHEGWSRTDFVLNSKKKVDWPWVEEALSALISGKPLQLITGSVFFYGLELNTCEDVLIPRPETEELVDMAVAQKTSSSLRWVDVGTGSGCIAAAIAASRPQDKVYGADVSTHALTCAMNNFNALDLAAIPIEFNILEEEWDTANRPLDVIISNPPYIPEKERTDMAEWVVAHDPELALFVPDDDPLLFYRALDQMAVKAFRGKGGELWAEIHENYGSALVTYFQSQHRNAVIHKDLQGKDRILYVAYGQ